MKRYLFDEELLDTFEQNFSEEKILTKEEKTKIENILQKDTQIKKGENMNKYKKQEKEFTILKNKIGLYNIVDADRKVLARNLKSIKKATQKLIDMEEIEEFEEEKFDDEESTTEYNGYTILSQVGESESDIYYVIEGVEDETFETIDAAKQYIDGMESDDNIEDEEEFEEKEEEEKVLDTRKKMKKDSQKSFNSFNDMYSRKNGSNNTLSIEDAKQEAIAKAWSKRKPNRNL